LLALIEELEGELTIQDKEKRQELEGLSSQLQAFDGQYFSQNDEEHKAEISTMQNQIRDLLETIDGQF